MVSFAVVHFSHQVWFRYFKIAIIAAIAIPNVLESRITSNEASASTSLKSGLLTAQAQFQGGNYADGATGEYGVTGGAVATTGIGGNGIGDYATDFNQLAGGDVRTGANAPVATNPPPVGLLPPIWGTISYGGAYPVPIAALGGNTGPNVNSYVFNMRANNEIGFVCVCSPADGAASIGRRRFAINGSGVVYSTVPNSANPQPTTGGGAQGAIPACNNPWGLAPYTTTPLVTSWIPNKK